MSVKNEEEAYEKIIDMSNNNDYMTGNLLDFAYYKENYKLIAIDLSKQTTWKDTQQINFIGKIEEQDNVFHHWEVRRNYFWIFIKFCKHLINMETQKIINLLNNSENEYWNFVTKKWYIIDSESKGNYLHENPIRFLTNSLESSLCDYSDAYILVTGNITVTSSDNNTKVAFKNCASFNKCRTEINETFDDEADIVNITMPM